MKEIEYNKRNQTVDCDLTIGTINLFYCKNVCSFNHGCNESTNTVLCSFKLEDVKE